MIGLILKDFIQMKRILKTFVGIMLLYIFIGVVQGSSAIIGTLGVMICVMAGISSLSMDEHGKWNQYALTLPFSRTQLVVAKYMMLLLMAGIMTTFTMLADIIISRRITASVAEVGVTVLAGSLLTVALVLPFMYKFGIERGRYMMLAAFLIPFLIIMIADEAGVSLSMPSLVGVIQFIEQNPWILVIFLGLWVACSMIISIQICKKKEY